MTTTWPRLCQGLPAAQRAAVVERRDRAGRLRHGGECRRRPVAAGRGAVLAPDAPGGEIGAGAGEVGDQRTRRIREAHRVVGGGGALRQGGHVGVRDGTGVCQAELTGERLERRVTQDGRQRDAVLVEQGTQALEVGGGRRVRAE